MADHSGHRQRMKEEFLIRGLEGWPDHRILELLLFYAIPQKDVNDLAHDLVDRFDSLAGVLDASVDELLKTPKVGKNTAVLLKLINALGQRYQEQREALDPIVRGPEDAAKLLASRFYGARNEMVYILAMDVKHKALGVRKVSEGSIHAADISIRRIVDEAVGLRAAALYLAHNHISNLAFPSAEDWQTTDIIRNALAPLGLDVVDHLIFVDGDVVSLKQTEWQEGRPVYNLIQYR